MTKMTHSTSSVRAKLTKIAGSIFLAFLFLLIMFQPAYAARRVDGSMPDVSPLQPMPLGAGVNVSKNIQFQDPAHAGQFNAVEQSPAPVGTRQERQAGAAQKNAGHFWLYVFIFFICAAGGAYWYFKRPNQ